MIRMQHEWDVLNDIQCTLGEGPLWDHRDQSFYWLDIFAGNIYQFDPATGQTATTHIDQKIGCMTLSDRPGIVLAGLKTGIFEIDLASGSKTCIAMPEANRPNNRFNDGKTDPFGNFWAGTMDEVSNAKEVAALYMISAESNVTKQLPHLSCSNGLAWSLDHKKFYLIDTGVRSLYAFDFDSSDFSLSNQKLIRKFEDSEGIPDGMTIDTEGKLWIAHWNASKVVRYDPEDGTALMEILLPVTRITSCCFGGSTFHDLYITTAKIGLSEEDLINQPLAGSVFVVRNLPYQGLKTNLYNLS